MGTTETGCAALWHNDAIRVGDNLRDAYRNRLNDVNLLALAADAHKAKGEPGGESDEETDKHFAWRFSNSAGRSVYVCFDPLELLGSVSEVVTGSLLDGDVVIVDVPCGGGAGALGLLSAIYEQRKALLLPTLPLNVRLIAGDYSPRARAHLCAVAASMEEKFSSQEIHLTVEVCHWNALDVRSSATLIDMVVSCAASSDRIVLLVSNFSAALSDKALRTSFEHFLSQFSSRVRALPNLICWVEPNTKDAMELLPGFDTWFGRVLGWFKKSDSGRVSRAAYKMCDPLTGNIYGTGVAVLKCADEGLPW